MTQFNQAYDPPEKTGGSKPGRYAKLMKKIIEVLIKICAIYLFFVGFYFIINEQIHPDYKLGPMPWWSAVVLIVGAAIPATALFFTPNSTNYRRIYQMLIAVILIPPLLMFLANTYDCFRCLYQDRYREGPFYIVTLSIGTLSCLLGFFRLISNYFRKKGITMLFQRSTNSRAR